MTHRALSLVILSLLLIFSIASIFSFAIPSSTLRVSASSCPSNNTVTFVTEPIPENFNYLTATGDSTFFIGSLEYLSLAPFPLQPNGSLDWADSATNWISANSNFTQWTYHIRPGLTWSNGTAVSGSDIATWLSPSYALNPNYDITGAHLEVTGVNVVNSDTATVILNQSDAQFPNKLTTYYYAPMVSPTDVAKGPADPLFGTGLADGPWYVSNYISGSTQAILLPNPYWPGPKPTVCEIIADFVETFSQITPFLVSGSADFAGPIAVGDIAGFASNPHIKLDLVTADEATPLWYNVTSYPYNMTQFRQALAYSINSSAIVQHSLFGYGVPSNNAQGGVPPTYAGYTQNQQMYPYNVSKALSLLHAIGFTGGGSSGPLKFPNGTQMSTTIYADINAAWDPNIAQQVASFLQALGINAGTNTMTTANMQADYASNAFNIQNNLVLFTSGGPIFNSPWLDAQPGCSVEGTPGCQGWFATPSTDGNFHWLYPANMDAQYQSNLTALDNVPLTNVSGQTHYLANIQNLASQSLPNIQLVYPDKIFAYNTASWTNWPPQGDWMLVGQFNDTMFNVLQPVTASSTSISSTSTVSLPTSTTTIPTATTTASTSISSNTIVTSKTTSSTSASLDIAIIILIIFFIGMTLLVTRRKAS